MTMNGSTIRSTRFTNGGVTRVAVCTDTHVWNIPAPVVNGEGSVQQLDASHLLVETMAECMDEMRPAVALHLGDQTSGGDFFGMPHDEFRSEVAWVRDTLCSLRAPVHALPGNHDCPEHSADWSLISQAWGNAPALGETIDVDSTRFVLINAQGHDAESIAQYRFNEERRAKAENWYYEGMPPGDPVAGRVAPAELARIEEALATAGKRRVILCTHQLLAPWSNLSPMPWRALYGIDNGSDVLALAEHFGNVAAVLQGHAHRYDLQWQRVGGRDCAFVVLPAVIEWPLAWLAVDVSVDEVTIELQRIPRPELAERGNLFANVAWRAGRPEWRRVRIA